MCAVLQQSGRACRGKHGAGVCRINSGSHGDISCASRPKTSATLVPAALADKAQFTRKRAAAEPTEDDMAVAMKAAVTKARGAAATKTPPKAMPKNPPTKAAPKARASHRASQPPCPRRAVEAKGQRSNWTSIWSAWELVPSLLRATCIWTSRKGGIFFWQGSPLQICCLPSGCQWVPSSNQKRLLSQGAY